ncbi:cytochrome c oxidase subunit I [Iamia majanohamensis]|uniref:Cytochrome c oxidase subunit 1 n=1 Tax=Iamia majanohamensis TaxID=467976 RepID=A0AAE9Y9N0_9ACTN|nr:cytochrome c oxidase subunit I [Iamia majanohamensis]WCO67183.1 cytochrome c oxidase subunit I [Iamia majanohamensis]
MTTTTGPLALPSGEEPGHNPLGVFARPRAAKGWRSWVSTVDHKRIAIMYGAASVVFFFIGGVEALLIRVQLGTPNGTVLSADAYNQVYTMHGTTMIFLVVMPLGAAFMNYLIPLQIGARDVAFPRLNALSFWTFLGGGILLNSSWLLGGGADGGWFNYAPNNGVVYSPSHGIDFWTIGLLITGIASLVGAINLIVTCLNLRAPGMTLFRMPVFTWMSLVTQFLLLFAVPVITAAQFLLLFDRLFGARFFDVSAGADPLLWQHLFWIFGHPEVYIMILPAFGIISEIIPVFSRKPLFGYPFMVFSGIAIGFMGWGVWAHHMFTSGIGPLSVAAFSISTMFIAVPTGVKIFNWLATMWGGRLKFESPLLYSIGLVTMFTIGGLSGVTHAVAASDTQQTDTYYIVAHFHYVLFGGAIFGFIGGMYFWWPKVFGHRLNDRVGKVNFWILLIGFNLTFGPMHILGLQGMPRRTYTYRDGYGFNFWNFMSTVGAFIIAVSFLVFAWNIYRSWRAHKKAGSLAMAADPWDARSLEWTIQSPTPAHNFDVTPTVHRLDDFWHRKYRENAQGKLVRIATSEELVQPGNPEGVHLPSPSYWPLVISVGLPFVGWGLIFNLWLCAVGGLLILAGIYGWVLEPATDPGEDHGPDDHAPEEPTDEGGTAAEPEEAALVD